MPWPQQRRVIGTKVQRLDGPDKATGRAKYSYDVNRPGMLHGLILRSPYPRAFIRGINTQRAERMPGVRAVWVVTDNQGNSVVGQEVFYAGADLVALAAETEEQALDAIREIQVDYKILPAYVKEDQALWARETARTMGGFNPSNLRRGGEFKSNNFDEQAYQGTAATVENFYGLPVICHQCLEPHGLVAEWNANQTELTVWCSTQAVHNVANMLARRFNLPAGKVKCITHVMGGGFGSKFSPGTEGYAAAELAKLTRAPVKIFLDRKEEVTTAGNRPSAFGTVKMAATRNGQIRAYEVDCYGTPGVGNGATVNLRLLPYVYTTIPFINRKHQIVKLNTGAARAMRAPGHPQNCMLTEWIIDELAARLNMNPMDLRLRNIPPNDPAAVRNSPTSFEALRHTIYTREIAIARRLSDWNNKWHAPGQNNGNVVKHGIGMAMHLWGGAGRNPNDIKTTIFRDGSVLVQGSTQDIGTGIRTSLAIVTAESLGLQPDQITIEMGESQLGRSTGSGGSTTCPGTTPAAFKAAEAAKQALLQTFSQRVNVPAANLSVQNGRVVGPNNQRWTWKEACARLGETPVTGQGTWDQAYTSSGIGGLQIAEVKVDTETGVVQCTKVVAVQDCGMVINKLGCESQVAGGVIMGVNYALFEERIMDSQTGRQVNPDMEFYKLAGIQDVPEVVVHMQDMPERGVIGIGEPPTISTCAAIGNAVYNALGVRVPMAPFTPERVLAALAGN